MSSAEVTGMAASELLAAFRARALAPAEVIDALAARIAEVDGAIGAFTTLALGRAREEALRAGAAYRPGGVPRPLEGLPLSVKDLVDTAGIRTTYGSRMFAGHMPSRDAAIVRRAREAGALVIGKTATHEFAWGITTDNPHFGPCRNPWAPDRVPGGSSGGSAAALAAHMTPLAIGTDTGGSIRIPAAFCGVVGLKPTYGRLSTAGIFPLARSLDHAGVLARTPADAGLLTAVLAGEDPDDPATAGDLPAASAPGGVAALTIGWCPESVDPEPEPAVAAAVRDVVADLAGMGAAVREVRLPDVAPMLEAFAAIQGAEAHHAHARAGLFPGRADEYGADVRARLERGSRVGVGAYLDAAEQRRALAAALHRLFGEVDVVVTPISSGPPARVGSDVVLHRGREIPFRDLVMAHTVLHDLLGLPSCSLRGGFDALGIPVGVQVAARPGADAVVLAVASALFVARPRLQARRPEPRTTQEVSRI